MGYGLKWDENLGEMGRTELGDDDDDDDGKIDLIESMPRSPPLGDSFLPPLLSVPKSMPLRKPPPQFPHPLLIPFSLLLHLSRFLLPPLPLFLPPHKVTAKGEQGAVDGAPGEQHAEIEVISVWRLFSCGST